MGATCGGSIMDGIINERSAYTNNVKRMGNERVFKRVNRMKEEVSRGSERSKLRRMDGMNADIERKGENIEDVRMCVNDRAY